MNPLWRWPALHVATSNHVLIATDLRATQLRHLVLFLRILGVCDVILAYRDSVKPDFDVADSALLFHRILDRRTHGAESLLQIYFRVCNTCCWVLAVELEVPEGDVYAHVFEHPCILLPGTIIIADTCSFEDHYAVFIKNWPVVEGLARLPPFSRIWPSRRA